MRSYKLLNSTASSSCTAIKRVSDNAFIPLCSVNRDCQQFVTEWRDGATVIDAEGNPLAYSEDAVRALGLTPL